MGNYVVNSGRSRSISGNGIKAAIDKMVSVASADIAAGLVPQELLNEASLSTIGGAAYRGDPDSVYLDGKLGEFVNRPAKWGVKEHLWGLFNEDVYSSLWLGEANNPYASSLQQMSLQAKVLAFYMYNPDYQNNTGYTSEAERLFNSLVTASNATTEEGINAFKDTLTQFVGGGERLDSAVEVFSWLRPGNMKVESINLNEQIVREVFAGLIEEHAGSLNRLAYEVEAYSLYHHLDDISPYYRHDEQYGFTTNQALLDYFSDPYGLGIEFSSLGKLGLLNSLGEEVPYLALKFAGDNVDKLAGDLDVMEGLHNAGFMSYTEYENRSFDAWVDKQFSRVSYYTAGAVALGKIKPVIKMVGFLDAASDVARVANKVGDAADGAHLFDKFFDAARRGRLFGSMYDKFLPSFMRGKRIVVGGAAASEGADKLHATQKYWKINSAGPRQLFEAGKFADEWGAFYGDVAKIEKITDTSIAVRHKDGFKIVFRSVDDDEFDLIHGADKFAAYNLPDPKLRGDSKVNIAKRSDLFGNQPEIIVNMRSSVFESDRKLAAIFAHEYHEVFSLYRDSITGIDWSLLNKRISGYHNKAVDLGDDIVNYMRKEGF